MYLHLFGLWFSPCGFKYLCVLNTNKGRVELESEWRHLSTVMQTNYLINLFSYTQHSRKLKAESQRFLGFASSNGPLGSAGVKAHLSSGLDQLVFLRRMVFALLQMNSGAVYFSVNAEGSRCYKLLIFGGKKQPQREFEEAGIMRKFGNVCSANVVLWGIASGSSEMIEDERN